MAGSPKKRAKREAQKASISTGEAPPRAQGTEEAMRRGLRPPFEKGKSGNPAGRPKKIYTILKQQGYRRDDIITCFHEMAWYTLDELKQVFDDPTKPVIMRTTANALRKALESGDMKRIEEILSYSLGKPTQRTELAGIPGGVPIPINNSVSPAGDDVDYGKVSTEALKEIIAARIKPDGESK